MMCIIWPITQRRSYADDKNYGPHSAEGCGEGVDLPGQLVSPVVRGERYEGDGSRAEEAGELPGAPLAGHNEDRHQEDRRNEGHDGPNVRDSRIGVTPGRAVGRITR